MEPLAIIIANWWLHKIDPIRRIIAAKEITQSHHLENALQTPRGAQRRPLPPQTAIKLYCDEIIAIMMMKGRFLFFSVGRQTPSNERGYNLSYLQVYTSFSIKDSFFACFTFLPHEQEGGITSNCLHNLLLSAWDSAPESLTSSIRSRWKIDLMELWQINNGRCLFP